MTRLKHRLLLWLTKKLLPIIDDTDVLTFNKQTNQVYIGGILLAPQEIANIREEIKMLETLRIWEIITKHLNQVARRRMLEDSKDFTDMLVGKLILYTIDVQLKLVEKFKNVK